MQRAAQGLQYRVGKVSVNRLPAIIYFSSPLEITCSTFSTPTSSTTCLNNSYKASDEFIMSDASMDFRNTVPSGQYAKKHKKVLFVSVHHCSTKIEQPVVPHVALILSMSFFTSSTEFFKIQPRIS
ncbi:hypothetical protein ACJW30_06G157400 [Castanea mollissima]